MGAARKLQKKLDFTKIEGDKRDVYCDFFCGGGGLSKGFARAIVKLGITNVRLIAINHSQIAVDTHKENFPWAEHYCSRVDQLDPRKLVPRGRIKVAAFAPECTNHANARGGRPINDQSRATAWDVIKWAQECYIDTILVENVREIMQWGPLGANGKPLKSRKGEIFRAWIEAIKKCGYRVEYRILNAMDYGAVTIRKRFFLIAKRGNDPIHWPEPTHSKDASKGGDLFGKLKPWRHGYEVIDWSKPGIDIMEREKYGLKPLAKNTLARIEAGIRKFWGPYAEPFIVQLRGTKRDQITASAHSVEDPLNTVTGGGIHAGLVQPFIIAIDHGSSNGNPKNVSDPVPAVMTKDRLAIVQPFILQQQSGGVPRSTDDPVPSLAGAGAIALIRPFLVTAGGAEGQGRNPKSVEDPLGTILPEDRRAIVQPFIVPFFGERDGQAPRTHSVEHPLPAVTSHGMGGVVQPFVVQVNHGAKGKDDASCRVKSMTEPIGTVTGEKGHGLVQPFLVKYYRTGIAKSVSDPIDTITGDDRFGLVTPVLAEIPKGYELRAFFRMFTDNECARAQGFEGHEFKGTKKQKMLMIGNAVEVHQAEALWTVLLWTRARKAILT